MENRQIKQYFIHFYYFITGVSLKPTLPVIIYEYGEAEFKAVVNVGKDIPVFITNITWTLNDNPLDQLSGISIKITRTTIELANISASYDQFIIKCIAVVDIETYNTISCNSTGMLRVQGEINVYTMIPH